MATCGNCKTTGVTVAHVRACYNRPTPFEIADDHPQDMTLGEYLGEPEPVVEEIPTLNQQPEEGVFFGNGTYYKVVQSPSTGNWYAKEYDKVDGSWEYAGRAPLHFLTALDRVTAEQASRFGKVTSTCVFCARKLTDDRSIFVGYGEICAGKNSLPWGEVPMLEEVRQDETGTEYQIRYQNTFGRADNE